MRGERGDVDEIHATRAPGYAARVTHDDRLEALGRREGTVAFVVAAVLSFAIFGASLAGEFVWDDTYLVAKNPLLTAPDGWWRLLVTDLWGGATGAPTQLYHPLPMLTLWAQARVTGLSIVAFRMVNVLLHAGCSALFFQVLRAAGRARLVAAAIAAVFLVHPLAVEPVLWITGRHDTLAVLLVLASLLAARAAVLADDARRGAAPAAAAGLACGAAFACKEGYVTAPALLAGWTWMVLASSPAPKRRRAIAIAAPAVALITVGAVIVARRAIGIPTGSDRLGLPLSEHLQVYGTLLGTYLRYAVTFSIGATTRAFTVAPISAPLALLAGAAVALFVWATARGRGTLSAASFGAAWFALLIAPNVLSLPMIGIYGNRYGYAPLLGLLFAAAIGLEAAHARLRPHMQPIVRGALGLLLLGSAVQSAVLGLRWHDERTLFGADVAEEPNNPYALYHLGVAAQASAGCRAALPLFARAAEILPSYDRAVHNLAGCLINAGLFEDALGPARRAVELRPAHAGARQNLAVALYRTGHVAEARAEVERGLALDPQRPGLVSLKRELDAAQ